MTNIVVLGASGTGKSTFLERLKTAHFKSDHEPTIGWHLNRFGFETNHGPVAVQAFERGCEDMFNIIGLDAVSPNAAIIFGSSDDLHRVEDYISEIGDLPYCVVFSHCDTQLPDSLITQTSRITEWSSKLPKPPQVYMMSSKSNYNIEEPFLHVLRESTRQPDLVFVGDSV